MAARLQGPIRLLGCGKMGGALAAGWLDAGLAPAELQIVEPDTATRSRWAARGARCAERAAEAAGWPEPRALVLAVKPQTMAAVLPAAAELVAADTVVLSIAAGTTLATLRAGLGRDVPLIRAMPNTPAAVGRGATALFAAGDVDDAARALAEALLATVGGTFWLDDEAQMHAVTALSGSGPAYVFLLIEAMAAAGTKVGLPPELALALARATVSGAGELVHRSDEPPAELRRNVTSPGGTTAAALGVLMAEDGLGPLVERAIAAAAARSDELGRAADR